ncbi:N-acetyltransferase [Nocardioides marmoriginsengisoli]|uniref:N-acetyltransferase n=1 Tax=Nocardioides marmoriginsengisoli TaxID=661483 RepID=A0A3N0CGD0_9ACTN|nr:GNAT family N-acetyltransferase [Nocardioides marmoriginsengisoli]RNL62066.1 N-acetyltransferase [Nocardioides marmoriginsengisoli]
MDLPDVVSTVRLRLELVSPAEARAMLGGGRGPAFHPDYPRKDDLDALSMIGETGSSWSPRHVVRAFDGLVVGSIGFYGPPEPADDGVPEAEVGYGLVADARGHGAATEALRGLLEQTDQLGVRVRASTEPGNKASVRVLAKCGFTSLRGSDADGNLVMARPVSSRPADPGR